MAIMDTLGRFMLPLRIVQAVFTFIVLVMTAYGMSPAQDNLPLDLY